MDKSTTKALHGSVRKWIKVYEGKVADHGARNCPLCEMFIDDDCLGCPVKESTGRELCRNTPYADWTTTQIAFERLYSEEIGWPVITPRQHKLAEKEALFLISLLPAEEQARYY